MNRPINIAGPSTAHSQAKEFAALASVASAPADVTTLQQSLKTAIAKQTELTEQNEVLQTELKAEKEAHAKTQAALTAATAS